MLQNDAYGKNTKDLFKDELLVKHLVTIVDGRLYFDRGFNSIPAIEEFIEAYDYLRNRSGFLREETYWYARASRETGPDYQEEEFLSVYWDSSLGVGSDRNRLRMQNLPTARMQQNPLQSKITGTGGLDGVDTTAAGGDPEYDYTYINYRMGQFDHTNAAESFFEVDGSGDHISPVAGYASNFLDTTFNHYGRKNRSSMYRLAGMKRFNPFVLPDGTIVHSTFDYERWWSEQKTKTADDFRKYFSGTFDAFKNYS